MIDTKNMKQDEHVTAIYGDQDEQNEHVAHPSLVVRDGLVVIMLIIGCLTVWSLWSGAL
jgi:hypothetical protein